MAQCAPLSSTCNAHTTHAHSAAATAQTHARQDADLLAGAAGQLAKRQLASQQLEAPGPSFGLETESTVEARIDAQAQRLAASSAALGRRAGMARDAADYCGPSQPVLPLLLRGPKGARLSVILPSTPEAISAMASGGGAGAEAGEAVGEATFRRAVACMLAAHPVAGEMLAGEVYPPRRRRGAAPGGGVARGGSADEWLASLRFRFMDPFGDPTNFPTPFADLTMSPPL